MPLTTAEFELAWRNTEVALQSTTEKFAPIHARYKKKEGYSKEDQVLLSELRKLCKDIGDIRYQLLKDYDDRPYQPSPPP